jgi:hypothetical protein
MNTIVKYFKKLLLNKYNLSYFYCLHPVAWVELVIVHKFSRLRNNLLNCLRCSNRVETCSGTEVITRLLRRRLNPCTITSYNLSCICVCVCLAMGLYVTISICRSLLLHGKNINVPLNSPIYIYIYIYQSNVTSSVENSSRQRRWRRHMTACLSP